MELEVDETELKAAGAQLLPEGRVGLFIHGWEIESRKRPILNSLHLQQWEHKLQTSHFPEMVFGDSSLVLKHVSSGIKIHFNTFDALTAWKQEALPPVEVPAAAKWKFRSQPFQQLDYDYTFTTPYCGSQTIEINAELARGATSEDNNCGLYWEDCKEQIDLAALASKEPILFYDEVILYEDELADSGVSLLTVKVRVMPNSWFLLLRFWLRVDGVLMRLRDTRMHCVFANSATPIILRESCWREATFKALSAKGYPSDSAAYNDPSIISQRLPIIMHKSQKLKIPGLPYQLDQIASEAHNQPKLSAFFALKNSPVSNDTVTCMNGQIKPETEHPSLEGGTIKEAHLSGGSMEHSRPCSGEWDDGVHGNSTGTVIEEPTCNDGKYSEGKTAEPSIHKSSAGIEDQASPCRPSASVSSHNTKRSISSAIVGPSKPQHSTLVDPNFVENYFKSSRLHFIGTWRSRYRKRFPSFKYTGPDVKVSSLRTSVIHVDMDSFFVSVVIRNHPELWDKPVAVCHSDSPRGTAEISSANYPARDYGVRAGIFVRNAKALCPHLVILPYDFEAYEQVADQFYNILHKHCSKVQAVSCDEAFLDVTESEVEDSQLLASVIRKEIFEATGCTASAGIAGNLLMARLATRAAKPDGQCYIRPEKVDDYLHELPIKALPGIGHVLEEKLKVRQIQTCGQLRMISKESLQKDFGIRTGDMLWKYSRGIDDRLVGVVQESKSVGAEVNWGVRFNDLKDCQHFLMNLCKEVSLRLQGCTVQGRCFTLKIKKRRNDAEPVKYMGCGDCENLSHSITVPMATDDVELIQRITTQLFGSFHIDVKDIRGMGLQVSKLESVDPAKQGHERNSIRSWLASASASTKEHSKIGFPAKESASRGQICTDSPSIQIGTNPSNAEAPVNQDLALPPLGDLDLGVIEDLPPDLFSEINDMYDGKLINLISKKKGKNVDASNSLCSMRQERVQVAINEGKGPFWLDPACVNESPVEDKEENCPVENNQGEPASEAGPSNSVFFTSVPNKIDLMPSSLSQVDISVLQQLPEELRVDILEVLPAHRRPECTSDAALGPTSKSEESPCLKCPEKRPGSMNSVSRNELWVGNPPEWVEKFKDSNCSILKFLADMYYRSGSRGRLSSILQCTLSESELHSDASNDGWDDAIGCLCDLLRQYIRLQIETDIEEIYVCFRLLRRFTTKSKFFFQVYNVVFPHLQASVGENYGGSLHISDGRD